MHSFFVHLSLGKNSNDINYVSRLGLSHQAPRTDAQRNFFALGKMRAKPT